MYSMMRDSEWRPTKPEKPVIKIRVMIVDEHPAVRHALKLRLEAFPNIEVVAVAQDCQEGMEKARTALPNVVLMELKGRNTHQPAAILEMSGVVPENPLGVIILTTYADGEEQQAAFDAGAQRYLLKQIDTAKLVEEIEAVARETSDNRHMPI
jgi:DNA-binding NarL/FixJ family response regulator